MTQPLFSIIIPMYNVEQYIERCLQSVFDQDIPIEQYEVLLINDGSPDHSEQIARAYCEGRPNIKIISQHNKGLGGARNTGIENATGDYLLFLDSDDWLLSNALRKLSKTIDGDDIIEFSVLVKNAHKTLRTIDFGNVDSKSGMDYFLENKTINSACNKMYRRTFLTTNQLIFKERIYGEDIQFNSRAFYLSNKIRSINERLIVFYQSDNSITRNQNYDQKLKYLNDRKIIIYSLQKFRDLQGTEDEKSARYFYERIALLTVNSILSSLKNKIPSLIIKQFVASLEKNGIFDIGLDIKERNFYRKLFHNRKTLQIILQIHNFRLK